MLIGVFIKGTCGILCGMEEFEMDGGAAGGAAF